MGATERFAIAGLSIPLYDVDDVLAELAVLYQEFHRRGAAFIAEGRDPHLCRAGCSHCCKSGAVFAVTLVEAVEMSLALERLPEDVRMQARSAAGKLHKSQERAFGQVAGPPDVPGQRDEAQFSTRVSQLNAAKPACPLLFDELCSIYTSRPLLCRAYGFPVDAYAVRGGDALVFRSLCVLYEGMQLNDYVRARDLKGQLTDLSVRMADGRDWRRFTSVEAVSGQIMRR